MNMKKLLYLLLIFATWMVLFSADTEDDTCTKKEEDPCENPIMPTASFTWDRTTIYPGDIVNFSYNGTDDPTDYSWDFGASANPTNAKTRFVSVIFTHSGTYDVLLRVKGECVWSATVSRTVVVKPFDAAKQGSSCSSETRDQQSVKP
jgi:PKD repeat protein